MNCQIIKLKFTTPVHFGNGTLSDAEYTLPAHTVFSALCHEVLLLNGPSAIQNLVDTVNNNDLCISDALPFIADKYYVPKPLYSPRREINKAEDDPSAKKKFKQLKYIPITELDCFCRGDFTADEAKNMSDAFELGKSNSRTLLANANREPSGDPYSIGIFEFQDNAGLYIFAEGSEDALKNLQALFCALGYSGLGGKRTSGLGKFTAEVIACPDNLKPSKNTNTGLAISLSSCMAKENELPEALKGASYLLKRAGGFIASQTYSDTPKRKRDFYDFVAGSVFAKTFTGGVFDVSNKGGDHPVWHYAAPVWIGVEI